MSQPLVECVPNISEGRVASRVDAVVDAIVSVPSTLLLHRTSDPDHNRSVITFAAPPKSVGESAIRAVAAAAAQIDLTQQQGAHPRLGALDVLPFVPLNGTTLEECVELAHATGRRIWNELGIPVFFYEAAARRPERERLENVRRTQFEGIREAAPHDPSLQPDLGGPALHPTAGAVIVGARKFLIAFNINLKNADISVARAIAKKIRESNGGIPGVKALGLTLVSRGLAQVSMNITDHEKAPLHLVYKAVESLAASLGAEIEESELIGLLPEEALESAVGGFLQIKNFTLSQIVETKIREAGNEA